MEFCFSGLIKAKSGLLRTFLEITIFQESTRLNQDFSAAGTLPRYCRIKFVHTFFFIRTKNVYTIQSDIRFLLSTIATAQP